VRKREFEVLGEELLDVGALNVIGLLELNNLEDLWKVLAVEVDLESSLTYVDRPKAGSMSGGHILVQSLNSICS